MDNIDPLGLQRFPRLRDRYLYGQFQAMQQYIRNGLITAGIVGTTATAVAATPVAAAAAVCYAPEAVVTLAPIIANPVVQQGVIDCTTSLSQSVPMAPSLLGIACNQFGDLIKFDELFR